MLIHLSEDSAGQLRQQAVAINEGLVHRSGEVGWQGSIDSRDVLHCELIVRLCRIRRAFHTQENVLRLPPEL